MISKPLSLLVAVIALIAMPVMANDKPDTPTTLKGGKVISLDEAKGLLDKKDAVFFDTRTVLNYGKGHIPGATVISYKEKSDFKVDFDGSQDQFELTKLPADKNAKVVFYSDGPKGWKSYKAAVLAVQAGYKNVMWMRDGFGSWSAKSLPIQQ